MKQLSRAAVAEHKHQSAGTEPLRLAGIWTSTTRDTHLGPMTFQFDFNANRMTISGKSNPTADKVDYYRQGRFEFIDGKLVSPVINNGQPVSVRLDAGRLLLILDEQFSFKLVKGD